MTISTMKVSLWISGSRYQPTRIMGDIYLIFLNINLFELVKNKSLNIIGFGAYTFSYMTPNCVQFILL